jgi:hypothetical protein
VPHAVGHLGELEASFVLFLVFRFGCGDRIIAVRYPDRDRFGEGRNVHVAGCVQQDVFITDCVREPILFECSCEHSDVSRTDRSLNRGFQKQRELRQ